MEGLSGSSSSNNNGSANDGGAGLMGGAPVDGYGNGGNGYGGVGAAADGYGGSVVVEQRPGDVGAVGVPPEMRSQVASWLSSLMVSDKGILFEGGPIKVQQYIPYRG